MRLLKGPREIEELLEKVLEEPVKNSGLLFRLGEGEFTVYADEKLKAAVAVEKDGDHCLLWGDWMDVEMPHDVLPKDGFFVSACPPDIIGVLKQHFETDGEWPCWHYLGPDGYGPGEWDRLGPLTEDDVPLVAGHWELGGDNREEHIRDRIRRFDSACVRLEGKPISWCGLHFELEGVGNLGFAHTLEEHRRKGHAAGVTRALVNRLSGRGMRATSHAIKDNEASISLLEHLGFRSIGELTWAAFKH